MGADGENYHAGQVDTRLKNLEDGQTAQWNKLTKIGEDVTEIKIALAAQAAEKKAVVGIGHVVLSLVSAALASVGTWFAKS